MAESKPKVQIQRGIGKIRRGARVRAKRAERQARELADEAVVLGVGAPAWALEKAGKTARDLIDAPSRSQPDAEVDTRPYEQRSKEELYELAREREIGGRSHMTKRELIDALRQQ